MSKTVMVGSIPIGSNHPVVIQSMTNTKTREVLATVNQIKALADEGSQIVRLAIANQADAYAIKPIKEQLKLLQLDIPLVADIHFDYKLALIAIEQGIDKLRLNPGNIKDPEKITKIINACRDHNIPIRIGVNGGSLDASILKTYQATAAGLIASAQQEIDLCLKLGFDNLIISLKTSDPLITLEAYRLAKAKWDFPLHIGLTEAGSFESGTVRSAYVLGTLLSEKIGDTIRVSLTGNPVKEVMVAKELLKLFYPFPEPILISCPTCGRTNYDLESLVNIVKPLLKTIKKPLKIAIMGCVVNGPGEARDADLGVAGGDGYLAIFKKGQFIRKISESELIDEFIKELNKL